MAHKKMIRNGVVVLIALCSLTSVAHGSGYGLFTQGASSLGQADAVVAHNDSPSTLFFNPALMNRLAGTWMEIGTTLLFPTRSYTAPDGYTASTRDTVFTPASCYLTHTFDDHFSAGIGVFNPFGLGTDWGGEWGGTSGGRYLATKSELTTWNINPAVSYRIIPALSIAVGLDILLLDATLENRKLSTEYRYPPPAFDVAQKFTGSGNGIGYNFGLSLELPYDISFGASYRSQVTIDVNGEFTADLLPQSVGGKATMTLPQQVFAGVACKPTDRIELETGMRWEEWSSFRQLQIDFAPNVFGLTSTVTPREWSSTYAFTIGGKFRLNESFALMAGYLHGWNPVPDSTFEPAIPDSDTNLYTVGGEARYSGVILSVAYGYQAQSDRYKGVNIYGAAGSGTYTSYLHLVGLSLGYTF
jgi:long-chain fatty acid transport protein